ncbi:MAG: hypothetical protein ACKV22_41710 [Bryobacteraceae bacterium]
MRWSSLVLLVLLPAALGAAEADALAISKTIRERHLPHGVIVDPIFKAPGSDEIAHYTRCGDAAIWTGHYLAAESYRYAATRSPEALDNVLVALAGIRYLTDVTGEDLLARCMFPVNSPFAPAFSQEEQGHGIHLGIVDGQPFMWVGNTSRDQYIGVLFGLSVAHAFVDNPGVKEATSWLGTRIAGHLLERGWLVIMPGGGISTTFLGRADQQLAILKIGRQLNPRHFNRAYHLTSNFLAAGVEAPIAYETLDPNGAYFKFNLDAVNLFNLIRIGGNSFVQSRCESAYAIFRRTVDGHGNAHFNMIDRALRGPDARRDAETRQLLEDWLKRPRRDFAVDLRGKYPSCFDDNRACQPIPVTERVPTDFLWQRSPFQLSGGGDGFIEGSGIDYILPYWMARYYGVVTE